MKQAESTKKRKASVEGPMEDKRRAKKTRKGLSLRKFTLFDSIIAGALYFCNEVIVKRLSKPKWDSPTDICQFLSLACIIDMVMPKKEIF